MPLSNSTQIILRSSPYWDDFSQDKRFHRILNKPRVPVQTRELNQVQSMLQNQIEQVTTGIFREGAAVTGGQQTFVNNVIALQIARNDELNIGLLYDTETGRGATVRGTNSLAEATIVQVDSQIETSESYAALIVSLITSITFEGGEEIEFRDPDTAALIGSAIVAPEEIKSSPACVYCIEKGVFFLRGHLVHVPTQTVVLSTTSNIDSKRIGFEIDEEIITATDDTTLLDPALETTNYAAPGADRLRLTARLVAYPIRTATGTQNADEGFIEIARVIDGVPQARNSDRLEQTFIEDTLARRTYDESGDYVVRPFRLTVKDHNPPVNVPNITGRLNGNTSSSTITASPTYTSPIIFANGVEQEVTTLFQSEIAVGDILVIGGEQREITAVVSNTTLTVNTSFSRTFENEIATVISNNKLNLELEAGKAYVRGYEFETLGTTKLVANRARTTRAVNNGYIGTSFGPYLRVKHQKGLFDVQTTQAVDLHGISSSLVNNATSTQYNSTKIGTAHIRSLVYDSGIGNANTVYKAYLVGAEFQNKEYAVTASANSNTQLTSVTVNSVAKTIALTQNTSGGTNECLLPLRDAAYVGATVVLRTVNGTKLSYPITGSVYSNTTADNHTQTLYVNGSDLLSTVNTSANVVMIFSDKCINGMTDGIAKSVGLNVDVLSKTNADLYNGTTFMSGTTSTELIFPFVGDVIDPASIADQSFEITRKISVTYSGSGNIYTLPTVTNEEYNISSTEPYLDVIAINSSTKAFVSLSGATYNPTTKELTISGSTANLELIVRKVRTPPAAPSTEYMRTKTLVLANTTIANVQFSGGNLVTNVGALLSRGHIAINNINSASSSVVGLGIADVYAIQNIYAVTSSNTWIDVTDNYTVDNGQRAWCYDHASITLKPGKTHYTINCTQLLVMADVFVHSAITGNANYFTARSYNGFNLDDIPVFRNVKTGRTLFLSRSIDFRPVRTANAVLANTATNPYLTSLTTFNETVPPDPQGSYVADYDVYLPRIDKIVASKDKQLRVVRGVAAENPVPPADVDNSITLYVVTYPPYTGNVAAVTVVPVEHKRYTMRDIGKLEKRIENLEYYAALSVLDRQTVNTPEYDENDVERFKNGILTDSFANQSIANFKNTDTKVAIDTRRSELRPSFITEEVSFEVDKTQSSNVRGFTVPNVTTGKLTRKMALTFDTTPFITQGLASTSVNINPFNFVTWVGSLKLLPDVDMWIDTITRPAVTINMFDENAGLQEGLNPIGTIWDTWTKFSVGEQFEQTVGNQYVTVGQFEGKGGPYWSEKGLYQDIQMVTPITHTQMRKATDVYQSVSYSTRDLGNRIVDTSVVPKLRGRTIDIVATSLRPGMELRAIFDGEDVTAFIERSNDIYVANTAVATQFRVGDRLLANTGATARVIGITDRILHVVEANGAFSGATISVSGTSNIQTVSEDIARSVQNIPVSIYMPWHGEVTDIINTAGVWTIQLGAGYPSNEYGQQAYVGKPIFFTDGGVTKTYNADTKQETTPTSGSKGLAGAQATVTAYASGVITIDKVPAQFAAEFTRQHNDYSASTPVRYSIGRPRTMSTVTSEQAYLGAINPSLSATTSVKPGAFYGAFRMPGWKYTPNNPTFRYTSSTKQFDTGERLFRLENANTAADANSFAMTQFVGSGQLQIEERQFGKVADITQVTQERPEEVEETVTEYINGDRYSKLIPIGNNLLGLSRRGLVDIKYVDPLAQSFVIDRANYPDGIYVTHTDLFFARAGDSGLDITVQIRAMESGVPSPNVIIGQGILTRNQINVIPSGVTPDATNSSHRTTCYFDQPIYLAPGVSYALTVLTNSNEYELFVGELGKKVIGTDNLIAEQPTGGVFFKSQNAETWTPEQTLDLMYVLYRAEFSTAQGTLAMKLANNVYETTQDFDYDLLQLRANYTEHPSSKQYTAFSVGTTNLDDEFTLPLRPEENGVNVSLTERMSIREAVDGDLTFSATLRTNNPHVSPVYDVGKIDMILVKNLIDNGGLYAEGFSITQGVPYTSPVGNAASNSYTLTITGGNGSGASVYANTNSTGYVTSIYVANAGSGYTETPTIAFPSANATDYNSVTPTFVYNGETSPSSGIATEQKARYITRTVTLADGFDSSDLKVYLSASRSQADNIDVYYKVLATGDPQRFEDKSWVLMVLKPEQQNEYATAQSTFREYEYRTENSTATYEYNGTTFDRFHSFAIKIVLRSENTAVVPRVRNLRVIALDE